MPKNIVICADGTGNAGGSNNPSNVWRIYEAVAHEAVDGRSEQKVKQVKFHDDGVGTQSLELIRALGGGVGLGLSKNLAQLYAYLVRQFEEGDRIYLFGFSRGAFTVRTFANMLYFCGIARKKNDGKLYSPREIDDIATKAVAAYRTRDWKRPDEGEPALFRLEYGRIHESASLDDSDPERCRDYRSKLQGRFPIHFVGAWDTVDAVGLPFDELTQFCLRQISNNGIFKRLLIPLFGTVFRRPTPTHEPGSSDWEDDAGHVVRMSLLNSETADEPFIRNAYHAISIDDERRTFHPTMYLEDGEAVTEANANIVQVWFPGVHANVGGGYPKDGLAYVALKWMMHHAGKAGLAFKQDIAKPYAEAANPHGPLYDARAVSGVFYRYLPRDLQQVATAAGLQNVKLHPSVLERTEHHSGSYAPTGVPDGFTVDDGEDDPRYAALESTKVIEWSPNPKIDWDSEVVKPRLKDRRELQNRTANIIWWRVRLYCIFIAWVLYWGFACFDPDIVVTASIDERIKERGLDHSYTIVAAVLFLFGLICEFQKQKTEKNLCVNSIRQLRSVSTWTGLRNTAFLGVGVLIFHPWIVGLLDWALPAPTAKLIEVLKNSPISTLILLCGSNIVRLLSVALRNAISTTEFSAWETLLHEQAPELPKKRLFLLVFHSIAGVARSIATWPIAVFLKWRGIPTFAFVLTITALLAFVGYAIAVNVIGLPASPAEWPWFQK